MTDRGERGRGERGPAMFGASARAPAARRREQPRMRAARRRAAMAKATLAATGTMIFATALGLARMSFAGHPKHPTALTAPDEFVAVVHKNLLDAGIIGPANAPPDVVTGVS